jgi:lambda repressor-like predicted transcriptional regulator
MNDFIHKAPKMRVTENQYIINRKVIMLKTGHSLGSLAEHVGHTKQAVSQAIQGRSTSLRIHRKIADVLNVRLVDFWPELYGEPTTTTTTTQGGDIRVG